MIEELIIWLQDNFLLAMILLIITIVVIADLRARDDDDTVEKKRILESEGGVPDFNAIRGRAHKDSIHVKRTNLSDKSYKRRE